jgi:PhzF family phenazine biosynthesis protein
MNPNFTKVEEICKKLGVGSVFPFTFETIDPKCVVHARCFAPLYGVNEDPVTGTVSGALGTYLVKHEEIKVFPITSFILEQEYEIDRPGKVFIQIKRWKNRGSDSWR